MHHGSLKHVNAPVWHIKNTPTHNRKKNRNWSKIPLGGWLIIPSLPIISNASSLNLEYSNR